MSYLMFMWIVRKKHAKRVEKSIRKIMIVLIIVPAIIALLLLGLGEYDAAYLWCWIAPSHEIARLICFDLILLFSWALLLYFLWLVELALQKRADRSALSVRVGDLLMPSVKVQLKLRVYVGVFIALWLPAVLNRMVEWGVGHPVFALALLEALFLPLQGFCNAVIYGDFLGLRTLLLVAMGKKKTDALRTLTIRGAEAKGLAGGEGGQLPLREVIIDPPYGSSDSAVSAAATGGGGGGGGSAAAANQKHTPFKRGGGGSLTNLIGHGQRPPSPATHLFGSASAGSSDREEGGAPPRAGSQHQHQHQPEDQQLSLVECTYVPKQYSIFTSTLNLGEAPLEEIVPDLPEWIIPGHDIYAVGCQECLDLAGLQEKIHAHLGGPQQYRAYSTMIGSGNTRLGYHGFIALMLFVRASEVEAGHIYPSAASSETMATGTDLIVTTAQNKGAVGIPLQIYDTNIGFVTCHLPSDSKGKSKLSKRNASAHSILKEVTLAAEDLGFDLHLQHDHILVFGDMNYRMDSASSGGGMGSLTGVAVACLLEKTVFGDDPQWLRRKYNLLRSHNAADPLFPSHEELKLLKAARHSARGAWSSVLRADELRSIMDDGDAFSGFEEPMPCFPPSYKRRKGKVEGSCGDYTDALITIQGFTNTGEVEELRVPAAAAALGAQAGSAAPAAAAGGGSTRGRSSSSSPGLKLSKSSSRDASSEQQLNSSHRSVEGQGGAKVVELRQVSGASSGSGGSGGNNGRNDDSGDSDSSPQIQLAAASAQVPHVVDAKKLRPPSYTDRILLHSLADRRSRLRVQAYDMCDELRVSDHRAVSMTLVLEVSMHATKPCQTTEPARRLLYVLCIYSCILLLFNLSILIHSFIHSFINSFTC